MPSSAENCQSIFTGFTPVSSAPIVVTILLGGNPDAVDLYGMWTVFQRPSDSPSSVAPMHYHSGSLLQRVVEGCLMSKRTLTTEMVKAGYRSRAEARKFSRRAVITLALQHMGDGEFTAEAVAYSVRELEATPELALCGTQGPSRKRWATDDFIRHSLRYFVANGTIIKMNDGNHKGSYLMADDGRNPTGVTT